MLLAMPPGERHDRLEPVEHVGGTAQDDRVIGPAVLDILNPRASADRPAAVRTAATRAAIPAVAPCRVTDAACCDGREHNTVCRSTAPNAARASASADCELATPAKDCQAGRLGVIPEGALMPHTALQNPPRIGIWCEPNRGASGRVTGG